VNPAEDVVQLGRDQELPVEIAADGRLEPVSLRGQVQHLVAGRRHPAAAGQARVVADEPEAAGEEAVEEGVLGKVERHLALQSHLATVGSYGRNNDYFDISVVDELFEPNGGVKGDRVEECVVEEIVNITVAGHLQEALERLLQLLE